MPIIKVIIDKEKDILAFWKYLYNHDFLTKWPHVSKSIYKYFIDLKPILDSTQLEDAKFHNLSKYIENFYISKQNKIKKIFGYLEKIFKKNEKDIFNGLRKAMDYVFVQEEFYVRLSILPSSTFSPNAANLSILEDIGKIDKYKHYLDIFLHEISHTIFEEQIQEIYLTIGKLNIFAHHYLKEIFAPIIIRDQIFDSIRQSNNYKYANTQQQMLNIKVKNKIYNIVDYFENIYKNSKQSGNTFHKILEKSVKIFMKLEDIIIDKHNQFHQLHTDENLNSQIFKDKLINNGYAQPINY